MNPTIDRSWHRFLGKQRARIEHEIEAIELRCHPERVNHDSQQREIADPQRYSLEVRK